MPKPRWNAKDCQLLMPTPAHPSATAGNWRHLFPPLAKSCPWGRRSSSQVPLQDRAPGGAGDSAATGPEFVPWLQNIRTSTCPGTEGQGVLTHFLSWDKNQSRNTLGLSLSCPMSPRPKEPCSLCDSPCSPCLQTGGASTGSGVPAQGRGHGAAASISPLGVPCGAHDAEAIGQK